MVRIREFEPQRDHQALRRCLVELLDFEHELDPRKPPGEQVADAYLDLMFRRCHEFDGVVLVAEIATAVIGFVTIWKRFRSSEPADDPQQHGYVSDLVVCASHRGRGIGRSLLRAAEVQAGDAGARSVRVSVMASNTAARSLYAAEGFVESEIYLEKHLSVVACGRRPNKGLQLTRHSVL